MHTDRTPIGAAAIVSALFSALWITLLILWLALSRTSVHDHVSDDTTNTRTTIQIGAPR